LDHLQNNVDFHNVDLIENFAELAFCFDKSKSELTDVGCQGKQLRQCFLSLLWNDLSLNVFVAILFVYERRDLGDGIGLHKAIVASLVTRQTMNSPFLTHTSLFGVYRDYREEVVVVQVLMNLLRGFNAAHDGHVDVQDDGVVEALVMHFNHLQRI
jgi:hypothetical protein